MTHVSRSRYTSCVLALIALAGCGDHTSLDTSGLSPSPTFGYSDTLTGTIVRSSAAKDVGDQITFVGLTTPSPRVVFARTGGISPMTIIAETDALISLHLTTGHSSDAFVIEKKTGFFTRTYSGSAGGLYSGAAIGACK